jgi:hypothetical protein
MQGNATQRIHNDPLIAVDVRHLDTAALGRLRHCVLRERFAACSNSDNYPFD